MENADPVAVLERDLRAIFGDRLQSLVVYGQRARAATAGPNGGAGHVGHAADVPAIHTLAVVDRLSHADLLNCAARTEAWHDAGLDTPLLLGAREFGRSLDAFPFEFGAILADHVVVAGKDPFLGLGVEAADLRRACEVQARGHLLHLREGYLETRGRPDALAVLIVESASAFAALIASVASLDGAAPSDIGSAARHVERRLSLPTAASDIVALAGAGEISSAEAQRLFPPYLDTIERLVGYIDTWKS